MLFGTIVLGLFGLTFSYIFYILKDVYDHRVQIDLKKTVNGLNCPMEQLKMLNQKIRKPLHELRQQQYFRIFKVNLEKKCPFWAAKKICSSSRCPVCVCKDEEIPVIFKKTDKIIDSKIAMGWTEHCGIHKKLELNEGESVEYNKYNFEDQEGIFVDLINNSEAYTGYNGTNIWPVVYQENCFINTKSQCQEDQILSRLISGIHASINCHICQNYMDQNTNQHTENVQLFFERVGHFPDRIENIYFTYSIFLKAYTKVYEYLQEFPADQQRNFIDTNTQQLLDEIYQTIQKLCKDPFKEEHYFQQNPMLKNQIFNKIVNISRIMDCVECEKCQLHGKMQILGIGSAFRLLFNNVDNNQKKQYFDEMSGPKEDMKKFKRNQFIALVNTLGKLSNSLSYIDSKSNNMQSERMIEWVLHIHYYGWYLLILFFCFALFVIGAVVYKYYEQEHQQGEEEEEEEEEEQQSQSLLKQEESQYKQKQE